jgi:hypothetical protein
MNAKKTLFSALLYSSLACLSGVGTAVAQSGPVDGENPEIYEWRIYTLAEGADADLLDDFFRDHLIPAYGRHGIAVGAFSPADTYPEFPAGARYLFMRWPDIDTFRRVSRLVRDDDALATGGAAYFDASAPNPVFTRQETYLCEALAGAPPLRRPDASRGLLEFRIYRSPNMEANERKIKMFENGEIAVFEATGINGVYYGRTLAGPRMPSLTYLTWYENAETRAEAWARFGVHPEWQRMRALPEYANTATDNLVRLLTPMPWSGY